MGTSSSIPVDYRFCASVFCLRGVFLAAVVARSSGTAAIVNQLGFPEREGKKKMTDRNKVAVLA